MGGFLTSAPKVSLVLHLVVLQLVVLISGRCRNESKQLLPVLHCQAKFEQCWLRQRFAPSSEIGSNSGQLKSTEGELKVVLLWGLREVEGEEG